MFVPVPILIAIGLVFLLMVVWMLLTPRGSDPLLGKPAASRPLAPPLPRAPMAMVPLPTLPPEIEAKVRGLLAAGRKLEAIKIARDTLHLGLKDAKDFVESLE